MGGADGRWEELREGKGYGNEFLAVLWLLKGQSYGSGRKGDLKNTEISKYKN